jgi:hypothetical protein
VSVLPDLLGSLRSERISSPGFITLKFTDENYIILEICPPQGLYEAHQVREFFQDFLVMIRRGGRSVAASNVYRLCEWEGSNYDISKYFNFHGYAVKICSCAVI